MGVEGAFCAQAMIVSAKAKNNATVHLIHGFVFEILLLEAHLSKLAFERRGRTLLRFALRRREP